MGNNKRKPIMLFAISYGCLGMLIGNMVGLSADSLVKIVISVVFAFSGGSVLVFLHKLSVDEQRMAAIGITTLSIFCLLGIYIGILQAEYRIFTPQSARSFGELTRSIERKYLRSSEIKNIFIIDTKYRQRQISAEVAYDQLFKVIENVK